MLISTLTRPPHDTSHISTIILIQSREEKVGFYPLKLNTYILDSIWASLLKDIYSRMQLQARHLHGASQCRRGLNGAFRSCHS
jgi:hypothetical protein